MGRGSRERVKFCCGERDHCGDWVKMTCRERVKMLQGKGLSFVVGRGIIVGTGLR